jgi:hypothetical protein
VRVACVSQGGWCVCVKKGGQEDETDVLDERGGHVNCRSAVTASRIKRNEKLPRIDSNHTPCVFGWREREGARGSEGARATKAKGKGLRRAAAATQTARPTSLAGAPPPLLLSPRPRRRRAPWSPPPPRSLSLSRPAAGSRPNTTNKGVAIMKPSCTVSSLRRQSTGQTRPSVPWCRPRCVCVCVGRGEGPLPAARMWLPPRSRACTPPPPQPLEN